MNETTSPPQPAPAVVSLRDAAAALPAVQSGARWFWWIAGLSLVNIVMFQSGSNTSFVMGLGITAVSDAVFVGNKPVGFAIDAIAIGLFVLVGYLGRRASLAAFYLGVTVYTFDALIFVYIKDWMPVAFHGLAIYFIVRGILALQAALKVTA
ncbi:MAG TPA: hypothetical protein VE046_03650 [Steroidobacteraceae bacterium]|nr:hypothetical protein [Steroidobacteraceae bacterium]